MEAATGNDALLRLRVGPPDLIILDMALPDTEGLAVLHAIRATQPRCPVIATSGRVGPLNALRTAESFGAAATLAKPFSLPQLLAIVDQVGKGRNNTIALV